MNTTDPCYFCNSTAEEWPTMDLSIPGLASARKPVCPTCAKEARDEGMAVTTPGAPPVPIRIIESDDAKLALFPELLGMCIELANVAEALGHCWSMSNARTALEVARDACKLIGRATEEASEPTP